MFRGGGQWRVVVGGVVRYHVAFGRGVVVEGRGECGVGGGRVGGSEQCRSLTVPHLDFLPNYRVQQECHEREVRSRQPPALPQWRSTAWP